MEEYIVHNRNTEKCKTKWRKVHLHFGENCKGSEDVLLASEI